MENRGIYLRNQPDQLDDNVQRITIDGKIDGHLDIKQDWLFVFPSRCSLL